jgi:hypothetical protein
MLLTRDENLMAKARKKIPAKIADEVMFRADLLCCVCENRGDQIHHIEIHPTMTLKILYFFASSTMMKYRGKVGYPENFPLICSGITELPCTER